MAQDTAVSKRTGLWVAGGVLVLLLLGIVGIKFYFTPERLRTVLIPVLEKELKRPVQLKQVGLNLWGGIEASAEGLTVSDRPGFGTTPFIAADRAGFSLAFWPLLKGEAKLGEVRVEKPRISVVIDQNGQSNYADLAGDKKEATGSSGAGLAVSRVLILGGQVEYEDRQAGSSMRVEGIDYQVQATLGDGGVVFLGDLSVADIRMYSEKKDTLHTGAFRVVHTVWMAAGGDEVELRSLRMDVGPLALNVTGKVRNLPGRPELLLTVENPEVEMERVATYLAEAGVMAPGAKIRGNARVSARIEGVWDTESTPPVYPDVEGKASLKNLSIDGPGLSVENGVAEVEVSGRMLRLAGARADVGSGTVQMRAELDVRNLEGPFPVQASVELDRLDLAALAGPFLLQDETISGRLSGALQMRGALDQNFGIVQRRAGSRLVQPILSGTMTIEQVRYKSPDLLVPVEEMAAAFSVKEDVIRISQFTGRAGRSDFSAVGRLEGALAWGLTPEKEKPSRPFLALDLTSRVLDLDEMIPVVVPGQASLSNPGWSLVTPAYGAAPAQDLTSPVLWLVRTANAKSEVQVGELKSEGVHYRNLRADALAQDGLLRLDNVRAGLFGGTMKAQVEVDARPASGTLPVRASVGVDSVQAGGMLGKFMKWRLPLQGRMGLSLTMDGKLDSTLELVEKDIQAEGVAGMEEGKLVNWSALKEMGAHVSQLGFLDFSEVPIQSLLAPFRIEHSRVFLNELKMNAAGLACRLNGSAGIDGSLDYTLDVDLPASRLNVGGGMKLGSALGSFFGGGASAMIPLRIRIGGTADQPQVKADLQPAGKTQAKEKEAEVRDKVKEKGKGLLKKLF